MGTPDLGVCGEDEKDGVCSQLGVTLCFTSHYQLPPLAGAPKITLCNFPIVKASVKLSALTQHSTFQTSSRTPFGSTIASALVRASPCLGKAGGHSLLAGPSSCLSARKWIALR